MALFQMPQAFITMVVMGVSSLLLLTGGMAKLVDAIASKRRRTEMDEEERIQRAAAHRLMGWTGLLLTACIVVFTEAYFRGLGGLAMGAVLALPVAGGFAMLYSKVKK